MGQEWSGVNKSMILLKKKSYAASEPRNVEKKDEKGETKRDEIEIQRKKKRKKSRERQQTMNGWEREQKKNGW